MKKLLLITLLGLIGNQSFSQTLENKQFPIKAIMIKPQMQDKEYMVNTPFNLPTMYCTNGKKDDRDMKPVKYYQRSEVYTENIDGFNAKDFIRLSIFGDVLAKMIESDAVFVGGNATWPVVVGAEVAKEGIIQYSEKYQVDPDKKEKSLNVTAGISTGTSIANLAVAAGASNPLGVLVGLVGGALVYNQTNKQYELHKKYDGKIKVIMYIDHPTDPNLVVACQ